MFAQEPITLCGHIFEHSTARQTAGFTGLGLRGAHQQLEYDLKWRFLGAVSSKGCKVFAVRGGVHCINRQRVLHTCTLTAASAAYAATQPNSLGKGRPWQPK